MKPKSRQLPAADVIQFPAPGASQMKVKRSVRRCFFHVLVAAFVLSGNETSNQSLFHELIQSPVDGRFSD